MYTRILVAVDGSHTSRRAFDTALALAKSSGAARATKPIHSIPKLEAATPV